MLFLLDRNALGEVARLVDVQAPGLSDVVGEELQRHATDEGGQDLWGLRNGEHQTRHPLCACISFTGHGDHVGAPGNGLLDVRERLLADETLAENGYDGTMIVHQGYGTVLHLARRVALGG